jgi:DNA-binding HxlR family transcriptional regulator
MSPRHIEESCVAVREVLNRVGDKWSVQIVRALGDEPKRFTELRRSIDAISQRMLTLTLKGLERDGLVARKVHPTTPPSVEYSLTPLGRTLLEPVTALGKWAASNRAAIQTAREKYDRRTASKKA